MLQLTLVLLNKRGFLLIKVDTGLFSWFSGAMKVRVI